MIINGLKLYLLIELLIIIFITTGCLFKMNAQSNIKIGAYYAGWMQGWYNNGRLPAEKIDFSILDYVIHFALFPKADGTFDDQANSIRESNSRALVKAAHSAGKKVLISVGGWNSAEAFRGATNPLRFFVFVNNLVNFMKTRGYDGIDIDWEPLELSDATQYISFIVALRAAMATLQPNSMLTAANGTQGQIFAQIYQYFDLINLMTYDLSGPWGGWVTWHNAPLYDGGYQFPGSGGLVPSAAGMVENFIAAGVPVEKIGIGIDFYGYKWQGGSGTSTGGVTEPRQKWVDPPQLFPNIPYYQIIEQYFRPDLYRWDSSAYAPYLQIDTPCDWSDMFVSYDDERSSRAKIEYAKKKSYPEFLFGNLVQEFFQIPVNSR